MKKQKRQVSRRKAGESSSAASHPKELVNFDEEEESTTKDVAHVLKYVKHACATGRKGRVHYFRFIVDPDSFSHTVENMFHFSFLVKVSTKMKQGVWEYTVAEKNVEDLDIPSPCASQFADSNCVQCMYALSM